MTPALTRPRRVREQRSQHKHSGVLVVSEDQAFIERVRATVTELGIRLIACLGPTASPCLLDETGVCPLAAGASIALIDAPPGGSSHSADGGPARAQAGSRR